MTKQLPTGVTQLITEIKNKCGTQHAAWAKTFELTFADTLKNALVEDEHGIFVLTGDIPAMWQRDSTAQLRPYLVLANKDPEIFAIISKVIKRQFFNMNLDPYANAFNQSANGAGHQSDGTQMSPWIWERKYEIDSLCYPVNLAYLFWKKTASTQHFDAEFESATAKMLDVLETELDHNNSSYYFIRTVDHPEDTLPNAGKGGDFGLTKMTWSAFRPSDDRAKYGYSIPANLFAKASLLQLAEIYSEVKNDEAFATRCFELAQIIGQGIQEYGLMKNKANQDIYAYETDGLGNYLFMDDANVPSLLSLPYLDAIDIADPIYQATRATVLSKENPYYYEGKYAKGLGSPHTPANYVWPIALAIEGLTQSDKKRKAEILDNLTQTTAGTNMMHEGFDVNDPSQFTREWFSWANMMFCELLLDYFDIRVKD
ncbi:glycoside hydrolase family 125 protein [Ligilactobacillus sp. Marseille-Q7487]|jgi:meiotically up-regulated gene 157 (Mug157) protein|uniref:glycoside hydrolase family 125 protein n=1 Tax=Ligilactobacillus sp. Marseille-Q7487 TaxID=3022128 RepID=UPI0015B5A462|nr:glycoside hydrolase family 125 protein [Ligilactobacillus sp. Marseille-Q7487]